MTNLHSDKIKTANLHTTTNHIYTNTQLLKAFGSDNNRAAIGLSYGNCGYNDGQQCRFCRYLSGLACRLNQYPCHTGTFSACRRWCDSLFTVSGKSQYKRCPPCCKTGIFCHGISVCTFICFLSDNKKATASCHFWCC